MGCTLKRVKLVADVTPMTDVNESSLYIVNN